MRSAYLARSIWQEVCRDQSVKQLPQRYTSVVTLHYRCGLIDDVSNSSDPDGVL
jgi:hypothetical protein